MEAGIVLIVLGLGLLSGSALLAFSWAAKGGQLENLDSAAGVIFDADELDVRGDCFPDEAARAARAADAENMEERGAGRTPSGMAGRVSRRARG